MTFVFKLDARRFARGMYDRAAEKVVRVTRGGEYVPHRGRPPILHKGRYERVTPGPNLRAALD